MSQSRSRFHAQSIDLIALAVERAFEGGGQRCLTKVFVGKLKSLKQKPLAQFLSMYQQKPQRILNSSQSLLTAQHSLTPKVQESEVIQRANDTS